MLAPRRTDTELASVLGRFVSRADKSALVGGDPVELVRRYADPHDQEVAGLFVAMMAYGRVASIKAKASRVLALLGPKPAEAVDRGKIRALEGFVHRFQSGDDLLRFASAMRTVRKKYGSLGAAFAAGTRDEEDDYAAAMGRFISSLSRALRPPISYGLRFLLPQPDGGGAAKRLCLYLRWMIRPKDEIDLGAWHVVARGLSASKLIVPLDTHIERIGRYLGLTDRKTGGMKTAMEITASLRRLRPHDPLYYDIALCHLGISGKCPRKRDAEICADCQIRAICRLGTEPEAWPW